MRVWRTERWHEVSVGVVSAAVFALLMLVTTLLHFDKAQPPPSPPHVAAEGSGRLAASGRAAIAVT